MKRSDFRFADPLRVRWAEVDMQKVVFNGHYLMYVDTAMGNWWRALALPYEATLAALDGDLFVRKATLEYLAPAHYDDALEVGIRFESAGASSLRFVAAVFRGDELLVHGEIVYVWTDAATKRPKPAPAALVDAFRAHAAGETMVSVEVGAWSKLGAEAQAIRTAVFVDEQKVPLALERDAADLDAVHALARNRLGLAVGTGRLLAADGPGHPARIGRMAVSRSLRRPHRARRAGHADGRGGAARRRRGDAACAGVRDRLLPARGFLRAWRALRGGRHRSSGNAAQALNNDTSFVIAGVTAASEPANVALLVSGPGLPDVPQARGVKAAEGKTDQNGDSAHHCRGLSCVTRPLHASVCIAVCSIPPISERLHEVEFDPGSRAAGHDRRRLRVCGRDPLPESGHAESGHLHVHRGVHR
jgi:YbgC/YbaW family acyl-CoA thioester hydrolase